MLFLTEWLWPRVFQTIEILHHIIAPELQRKSVYLRLRGIEDILAHPGEKRVLKLIQRSQIAVLNDLARLDLKALKKKDYVSYRKVKKDRDAILKRL